VPDRQETLNAHRLLLAQRQRARRELRQFVRRLGVLLGALLLLIVAGAIAFAAVEGTSVAYGFLWTLDTVTTLGSIRDPTDTGGRLVIVGLELLGIGTLFYGLATVAEFFVSGQLSGVLHLRRTQKMIDSYSDHYIICGYGRVGRQVVRDLRAHKSQFVVIDANPENRELARAAGVPFIEGEAADDDLLVRAGIERASAVVACVDSDAENIFIALSARELRSDILIVARASAEDSEKKLVRAGADRVISPYKTTGAEMARIALHPQISGAVDVTDFRVEEIEVPEACEGAGKRVADVRGRSVIVALRRGDGTFEPQPSPEAVIDPGDKLIALGTPEALDLLESVFQPLTVAAGT
jgi:voltage-gated potassium channel